MSPTVTDDTDADSVGPEVAVLGDCRDVVVGQNGGRSRSAAWCSGSTASLDKPSASARRWCCPPNSTPCCNPTSRRCGWWDQSSLRFVNDSPLAIRLRNGRLVIQMDPAAEVSGLIRLTGRRLELVTDSHRVATDPPTDGPASVAVEFVHVRPPGLDPTVPENRVELIRVTAVDRVQIAMAQRRWRSSNRR